jgi:hypothetical protein
MPEYMTSPSTTTGDDNEDKNYDPMDIDEELGLSTDDSDDDGLEDVDDDDDVTEAVPADAAKNEDEQSLEVLRKREEDGEDFR